ncbi:outer membrane beta-barrel protein [Chitinophaga pinensis]|uniref:Outer membrane protein beta-barrel domain-containing protein n=1 Tax=Chitinophaga pinensis (strain ATCC 43595 / DSM 2588 / LMG 13176 / NBRC 15968 / NCIMB 11800 / UQM 2034) TaxID=485918 RepID=A0A979H0V7_CHIPD|nr:outer membrane beta-barrel protein [Chitinophaga pinensis]ACU63800.1 hypothetical protein Cpin_6396 [Chitinophaga pinensis DSM 2588]
MQLLDDDMDELFRNAASDYPLNTGGGDWEAMQNRLQQADNNQQGTATRRLKDRWWFRPGLWFLGTILLLTVIVSGLFTGNRKESGREGLTADKTAQVGTADDNTSATKQNRQAIHNEKDIITADNTTGKHKDAGTASTAEKKHTGEVTVIPNTSNVGEELPASTTEKKNKGEGAVIPNTSANREGSSSSTVDNKDKTNTPATSNTGRSNEGIAKPATVAAENVRKGNVDKTATASDATTGKTNQESTVVDIPIVKTGKKNKGNSDKRVTADSAPLMAAGKANAVNTDKTAIGVTKSSTDNKPSASNNIGIVKGNRSTIEEDDQLNTRERVASQKGRKVAANVAGRDKRPSAADSEQSIENRKNGNIPVRTGETQDIPNNSSYPAARPGITAVIVSPLSIEHINGATVKHTPPQTSLLHVDRKLNIPVGALADSSAAASATKVKREPASLKKGLYYGLLFSPDLTTVKFQRTSNVGYNVGLLAGYRFGKKLAVETGVLYERKFYYSTGEYFNTTKTPWPADMDLINVDGWCNMYEIPVNVRFTFATGEKSSWYANAGMSSYIMKKQKYDYSYKYYGQYGERNWTYRKTTADWFSIIHLGVGYERPVGVLGTLRVEPYIKIPSRGIGIGDLPVTSVGMNIGLTRPLRLR